MSITVVLIIALNVMIDVVDNQLTNIHNIGFKTLSLQGVSCIFNSNLQYQ